MNFNEYANSFWTQIKMKCTWMKNIRFPEEALNYENRHNKRKENWYQK
jgi:hypothetical protein